MGDDPESTEPPHVFHNIARVAAERIGRLWQPNRDVVALRGTELDGVHHKNARSILRWVGHAGAVSMVGQNDELQPGPRGCGRYLVG